MNSYVTAGLACLWISTASAAVGDPHSFSRAMKWRGGFLDDTGIVLRRDCSAAPPAEHCMQLLPAPASTDFEEHDLQSETASDTDRSRFCVGGSVSKARLIDFYGLSATQATAFFAGQITLRLGIRGSARLLDDVGQFRFNVRFLSD